MIYNVVYRIKIFLIRSDELALPIYKMKAIAKFHHAKSELDERAILLAVTESDTIFLMKILVFSCTSPAQEYTAKVWPMSFFLLSYYNQNIEIWRESFCFIKTRAAYCTGGWILRPNFYNRWWSSGEGTTPRIRLVGVVWAGLSSTLFGTTICIIICE